MPAISKQKMKAENTERDRDRIRCERIVMTFLSLFKLFIFLFFNFKQVGLRNRPDLIKMKLIIALCELKKNKKKQDETLN